MKKIIVSAMCLVAFSGYAKEAGSELLAAPTYTQINKMKGGLFGYDKVTTDTDTNGNHITNCQNPGTSRCKIQSTAIVQPGSLNEDQLKEVDAMVMVQLSPESTTGTFVYATDYLVKFNYNIDANKLNYEIYTREEAAANGDSF